MTVKIGGNEVGFFETSYDHFTAYYSEDGRGDYYVNEPGPQAQGLYDILDIFSVDGTTHATRVGVHYSTDLETYSLFIHNGTDGSVGSGDGQSKTTCVNLATKIQSSGFVFEEGQGIATGAQGQTSLAFVEGTHVVDEGSSTLVFEEGTGVNFEDISTLVEDDIQDPNTTGELADSYEVQIDAVAQHGYSLEPSDGVMWPISPGTYSFTIERAQVDDGRNLGFPLPDAWYACGPGGIVQAGGGGANSISVELDLP
jgi:hypothetical protein